MIGDRPGRRGAMPLRPDAVTHERKAPGERELGGPRSECRTGFRCGERKNRVRCDRAQPGDRRVHAGVAWDSAING